MTRRILPSGLTSLALLALTIGCAASNAGVLDANNDHLADDLGSFVDANHDGIADTVDINHDGIPDGPAVSINGMIGLALDTDCDGIYDAVDTDGDGLPNFITSIKPPAKNVPGCAPVKLSGGGGGGTGGAGGAPAGGSGGAGGSGATMLGAVTSYQGAGDTTAQYAQSDVYRNGVGYMFIANGYGPGWQNHHITWNGTSFTVASLNGSQGANFSPAGYPTIFCGFYSMKQSAGSCGLPAAISSLSSVRTGWRWKSNGNAGQYNAAWDIWLGNGTTLSAYLMVWLRDPPGQQPAGSAVLAGATVTGLPGTWTIWTGNVNGHPIVNYVSAEGQDRPELEYNVLDIYHDAMARGYSLPGTHIMAVAVGYEVWNGPVTNLETDDFYVDAH